MYQIDIAHSSHKIYLSHLDFILSGIEDVDIKNLKPCDANACNFGKWLNTADNNIVSLKHFTKVVIAHTHFHECACHLYSLVSEGKMPEARVYFETALTESSDVLIGVLSELKNDRLVQIDVASKLENPLAETFTDDLLTNIPVIDLQHRELDQLTHRLLHNPNEEIHSENTAEILSMLNSLFISHFSTEEDFMRSAGISSAQLIEHIHAHEDMLEQIVGFNLLAMSHAPVTACDLYKKLVQLEITHMRTYDAHLRILHS